MKISTLLLCGVTALVAFSAPLQAEVDRGYTRAQELADEYYQEGDYRKAYRKYRDLAKVGDSFAQYRLSTMNLYGRGVSKDPVEAFAWSVLAAQNKHPDLVQYRDLLLQALPANDRDDAEEKAEKYMDRYGNLALAEKARRSARRQLSSCTGSRLSTRCEEVYVADMPLAFPGAGSGADGETTNPADAPVVATNSNVVTASESGTTGAGFRDAEYFQGLRSAVQQLDQYIAEHSGTVELGEFELLDEEEDG
ncbi:MAG: hypothetical protein R3212_13900 [Xanthomonadales bacterium]|nr:hypothetical protein [Xanthomonadales bacterium]